MNHDTSVFFGGSFPSNEDDNYFVGWLTDPDGNEYVCPYETTDGSVTPVTWSWTPGRPCAVYEIRFVHNLYHLAADGVVWWTNYGAITLTNGFVLSIYSRGSDVFTFPTIKTSPEAASQGSLIDAPHFRGTWTGNNCVTLPVYYCFPQPFYMGASDEVRLLIQDDISQASSGASHVQGNVFIFGVYLDA